MTTRRRRWDVLLSAALFLLLALLFVPECDDCYFIYWDFASWKDFLLVRPIPQEGVVLGVPSNGRYLGNLLGLILGKLAFSPLWPLRVLILGGGMLGLTLLLSRFFQGGPAGGRESFALALFLVVWAPWGIWQQVYSWSAAWANYLAPTLLLSPCFSCSARGGRTAGPSSCSSPCPSACSPSTIPSIWSSSPPLWLWPDWSPPSGASCPPRLSGPPCWQAAGPGWP